MVTAYLIWYLNYSEYAVWRKRHYHPDAWIQYDELDLRRKLFLCIQQHVPEKVFLHGAVLRF
jgi:hypothetical protein